MAKIAKLYQKICETAIGGFFQTPFRMNKLNVVESLIADPPQWNSTKSQNPSIFDPPL